METASLNELLPTPASGDRAQPGRSGAGVVGVSAVFPIIPTGQQKTDGTHLASLVVGGEHLLCGLVAQSLRQSRRIQNGLIGADLTLVHAKRAGAPLFLITPPHALVI